MIWVLLIMNILIFGVFLGGLNLAKANWSSKHKIRAVGIMFINIIVCLMLMALKNHIKIAMRGSLMGFFFV